MMIKVGDLMLFRQTITKHPLRVELKRGEVYHFCCCGLSKDQPLCDQSSHRRCEKRPVSFSVDLTDNYYLCGCKNSSHYPFCDGAHKKS